MMLGMVLDSWVPVILILAAAGFAGLAIKAFGRTRTEGMGSGTFVPFSVGFLFSLGLALMILAGSYD